MSSDLPRGVVFDCDGTIADTERVSDRVWAEVLASYGYDYTEDDARRIIGGAWPRTWRYLSEHVGIDADEADVRGLVVDTWRALDDDELSVFDDAVALAREIVDRGIPLGVATSSGRRHVERVLARAGIDDLVGAVVSRDDWDEYKPAPGPYARAAELLGVDPAHCSAVEDTTIGVQAAKGAGMWVVGIVRHHNQAEDLHRADRITSELQFDLLVPDDGPG